MQRITVVLFVLSIHASLLHAAPSAPFYLKTFDVEVEVEETGDLLITETLVYVFSGTQSSQRLRRIPLGHVDRIKDVQVYENGRRLRVKTSVKAAQFSIRWRHQLSKPGLRTFVVQYRAQGALRIDNRHDQVLWPALFEQRDVPIEAAQVTVRVPPSLAGQIQRFTHYGVPAQAWQVDDRTVTFRPQRALQANEGLTVKLYVPHGRLNSSVPAWQRGEEAVYRLPGMLGYIDALVFIVCGVGLLVAWVAAAAQKHQWEMERASHYGEVRQMSVVYGTAPPTSGKATGYVRRSGGTGMA
ncbi:MAG: DUF2207 domain-containing protein [bacterium]|nr:DUF2207 domain-containing protein [bacterium]